MNRLDEFGGLSRRALLRGAALGAGSLGLSWAAMPAMGAERTPRALSQAALKVAKPTQAVLQAVARAGKRLVAVGERGLVIYSDDAGQSWAQAQVPVSSSLTAVRFADAQRGWAVGNMGVVLATEDGGLTWRKRLDGNAAAALALQSARARVGRASRTGERAEEAEALVQDAERLVEEGADKPLLDISLRADGSLLTMGAYGLAFASRDDGRSWQSQMDRLPNPEGLSYYGLVERRGESLLFGEQGLLLRAASADATFASQTSPSQGSLFGALALREGALLLLGLRGKVWRSGAAGDAWEALQTPVEASVTAGLQLADGRVLLAGAAGQLLQSADGGQRFKPLQLAQRFPFTGLAQADDGALLLVGMRGVQRLTSADLKTAQAGGANSSSPGKPSV